jgi:hypothetical protein
MTDYTTDHRLNLEAYLATHTLPKGLGHEESACTLAAINIAMSGKLTDDIPDCMSEVLGKAAIGLQDAMPDEMRNSQRYKQLIPDMPGTGRVQEKERLAIMLDWMWSVVLPQLQPITDDDGLGSEWRLMCEDKTADAAYRAADAARAAAYAAAAHAARAVDAATDYAAARAEFWATIDPIGVLERMTYLKGAKP